MNRGARRQAVFPDDRACAAFLDLLSELPARFRVHVHGYALMPNHYHLLLDCPVGGLGRAMQYLQSRYAAWLNATHAWDGPVWRGRYRNRLVEDERWWAHLLAYLHLNPVRAHLVRRVDEARWTSHAAYVDASLRPGWLCCEELLELHGGVEAYRAYAWEVVVGRERGPEGFDAEALWRPARSAPVAALAPAARRGPIPIQAAWQVLSGVVGQSRQEIEDLRVGPGGNPARWVALDWLPRASGLPRAEIARSLGVHPTIAYRASARVQERRRYDPLVQAWCARLDALIGSPGGDEQTKVAGALL